MKILIIGCGRTGSRLGMRLANEQHEVAIIDEKRDAFERLDINFPGKTFQGSGMDLEVLQRARAQEADIVFALTGGDNRNLIIVQMVKHQLKVPRAVARLHDPVRAAKYHEMGIETICTTTIIEGMLTLLVRDGCFPNLPSEMQVSGDDSELNP